MNTYYRITIRSDKEDTLLHNEIKNELQQIINEMSVFEKTSDLSQFNKNKDEGWIDVPETLADILKTSYNVYMNTNGYFDPSVGKLIDIWGFGKSKTIKVPTQNDIDTVKKDTGFNQIKFSKDFRRAIKKNKEVQINLSAVAKGYAVDRIAKMLEDKNYKNFIVEIGGEVKTKGNRGKKEKGWNIGIARPEEGKTDIYEYIIKMNDMAVATSGDYRNYFYIDDKKYSHTIDPKTGYPVEHSLTSVTVFDAECAKADAMATAIMSMGDKKGLTFANNYNIPVIMFIRSDDGFQIMLSKKAQKMIELQNQNKENK